MQIDVVSRPPTSVEFMSVSTLQALVLPVLACSGPVTLFTFDLSFTILPTLCLGVCMDVRAEAFCCFKGVHNWPCISAEHAEDLLFINH